MVFLTYSSVVENINQKNILSSSSSVYGDLKKYPANELVSKQKNIYSLSKKFNEELQRFIIIFMD